MGTHSELRILFGTCFIKDCKDIHSMVTFFEEHIFRNRKTGKLLDSSFEEWHILNIANNMSPFRRIKIMKSNVSVKTKCLWLVHNKYHRKFTKRHEIIRGVSNLIEVVSIKEKNPENYPIIK